MASYKVSHSDFDGEWTNRKFETRQQVFDYISSLDQCQRLEIEDVEQSGDVLQFDELEKWLYNEDPTTTVLTASEVDDMYGLAEGTTRQFITRGQLPARQSGKVWLVRHSDAANMFGFDDDDDVEVYEDGGAWVVNTPIQSTPKLTRHEAYKIARAYRRNAKEYIRLINKR